jgi:hypothetical protein
MGVIKGRRYFGDSVYYTIMCSNIELKCTTDSRIIFDPYEEITVRVPFEKAMFYEM